MIRLPFKSECNLELNKHSPTVILEVLRSYQEVSAPYFKRDLDKLRPKIFKSMETSPYEEQVRDIKVEKKNLERT